MLVSSSIRSEIAEGITFPIPRESEAIIIIETIKNSALKARFFFLVLNKDFPVTLDTKAPLFIVLIALDSIFNNRPSAFILVIL